MTSMSHKTPHSQGRIRNTVAKPRPREVEHAPCTVGITHVLENTVVRGRVLTGCAFCGRSWSFLDQQLREAVK